MNSYLNLGSYYYDLIRAEPPKEAYAFYLSYAKQASGILLEPMCGSGRFLLPLVLDGFDIHGFDASNHMLSLLSDKANSQNLSVSISKSYIESFKSSHLYSLIFIPSGSFGHLIEMDMVTTALNNLYGLLEKDGTFVFEVETSKILPKQLDNIFHDEKMLPNGDIIQVERTINLENNIITSKDKYSLVQNDFIVRTEHENLHVRLYDDLEPLISMLNKSGFSDISIMSEYNRNASYENNSKVIILECRN